MNNQGTGYNVDDTGADGATRELYTGSYDRTATGSGSGSGQGVEQSADKAGQIAEQAKDAIGDTVGQVKQQAVSQIDAQKTKATDALGAIAQAVRQTGDNLRGQDQPAIANYADTAADQLERFSTYLGNRDFGEMVTEVQRFARRQPAVFLGGAVLAGLLAARFFKSSADQGNASRGYYGDSSYRGASGYGYGYGRAGYGGNYGGNYGNSERYGNAGGYSGGYGSGYDGSNYAGGGYRAAEYDRGYGGSNYGGSNYGNTGNTGNRGRTGGTVGGNADGGVSGNSGTEEV